MLSNVEPNPYPKSGLPVRLHHRARARLAPGPGRPVEQVPPAGQRRGVSGDAGGAVARGIPLPWTGGSRWSTASTIWALGLTATASGASGCSPICVHIRSSPAGARRSSRNAVASGLPADLLDHPAQRLVVDPVVVAGPAHGAGPRRVLDALQHVVNRPGPVEIFGDLDREVAVISGREAALHRGELPDRGALRVEGQGHDLFHRGVEIELALRRKMQDLGRGDGLGDASGRTPSLARSARPLRRRRSRPSRCRPGSRWRRRHPSWPSSQRGARASPGVARRSPWAVRRLRALGPLFGQGSRPRRPRMVTAAA